MKVHTFTLYELRTADAKNFSILPPKGMMDNFVLVGDAVKPIYLPPKIWEKSSILFEDEKIARECQNANLFED